MAVGLSVRPLAIQSLLRPQEELVHSREQGGGCIWSQAARHGATEPRSPGAVAGPAWG